MGEFALLMLRLLTLFSVLVCILLFIGTIDLFWIMSGIILFLFAGFLKWVDDKVYPDVR